MWDETSAIRESQTRFRTARVSKDGRYPPRTPIHKYVPGYAQLASVALAVRHLVHPQNRKPDTTRVVDEICVSALMTKLNLFAVLRSATTGGRFEVEAAGKIRAHKYLCETMCSAARR